MDLLRIVYVFMLVVQLLLMVCFDTVFAQDAGFELPVQLIGFPVIIMSVRMANFVKKLAYSLNPRTYTGRVKREDVGVLLTAETIAEAEKKLVAELGENVCIYENVCEKYAYRARQQNGHNHAIDWGDLIRRYERSPADKKKFYLLSVFIGDIIGSPNFCHQLIKRGRGCN